jgi:hypothetical protein
MVCGVHHHAVVLWFLLPELLEQTEKKEERRVMATSKAVIFAFQLEKIKIRVQFLLVI